MPVIAVAPCSRLRDYEESIRRAGGEVRVLDYAIDRPAVVVEAAAGLLLTGGADVHPALYGAAGHPTYSSAEEGRDAYEIDLVRLALERDVPLFAICRGVQVLNVARGGVLVRDIPTELPGALRHDLATPPHEPFALAHEVWVEEDSLLASLLDERLARGESCQVNSRHHQAVAAAGDRLAAVATAPDGVIEAVEDRSLRFCLGVQWHPENFYRTGEFRSLFEGFVRACGG